MQGCEHCQPGEGGLRLVVLLSRHIRRRPAILISASCTLCSKAFKNRYRTYPRDLRSKPSDFSLQFDQCRIVFHTTKDSHDRVHITFEWTFACVGRYLNIVIKMIAHFRHACVISVLVSAVCVKREATLATPRVRMCCDYECQ